MEKIIDLDALVSPGAVPGLSLGTLLQWAPILEQIIANVEQGLTVGGSFTPPPLKFKTRGRHVEIDETIKISP